MSEMKEINLKAFFHDPPHKPLSLVSHEGHEEAARKFAKILDIELTDEDFENLRGMDILASALERMVLPRADNPSLKINSYKEIIFRHPFSGKVYQLNLSPETYKRAKAIIVLALEELKEEFHKLDTLTQKLEFLWQNLLPLLKEKAPEIPWDLLPADTRIPDHSIWSHLKLSTVAGGIYREGTLYPVASLFIFTLGPVQKFIKLARKTQDFWAGSFMLSYLTFKAIETIREKYSSTSIIYPDLQAHPWIKKENEIEITRPTIPNRFVAILPIKEPEKLKAVAKDCESAIKQTLEKWMEHLFSILQLKATKNVEETVKRQINTAFVSYWTAFPFPELTGPRDYERLTKIFEEFLDSAEVKRIRSIIKAASNGTIYEPNIGTFFDFVYPFAEKSLAARKTLKDHLFGEPEPSNKKPADRKSRVERCHICGERNAILQRRNGKIYFYDEIAYKWKELPSQNVPYRYIPEGEALCGVCLMKRYLPELMQKENINFPKSFNFPSVVDIAVADFMEKLLKDRETYNSLQAEFQTLSKNSYSQFFTKPIPKLQNPENKTILEGEWLFESSLTKQAIKKNAGIAIEESKLERTKAILREIMRELGTRPCPYYALIAIDGDEMGKWLAGKKSFPLDNDTNIYHPKVWRNLPEDFKNWIKELFKISDSGKDRKRPVTPAYHATIARALQTFALKIVPQIVEKQALGKLIYVGGDDVLALVNLKDLWEVLRLLRLGYSGMIALYPDGRIAPYKRNESGIVPTRTEFLITMGPRASLSAGVVIAHYKTPLSLVIAEAFKMEKRAKNKLKRDAFSIAWLKHSGEVVITGGKWNIEKEPDTILLAQKIFSYFGNQRTFSLAKNFLKELRTFYYKLTDEEEINWQEIEELLRPLIKRAIKRHIRFNYTVNSKEKQEIVKSMEKDITALIRMLDGVIPAINLIEIGLIQERFRVEKED